MRNGVDNVRKTALAECERDLDGTFEHLLVLLEAAAVVGAE